jgi:hypothetical protein
MYNNSDETLQYFLMPNTRGFLYLQIKESNIERMRSIQYRPKSIREKYRLGRICISNFRGCGV